MCNIYLQQLKARVNRDNPRTQSLQNTYMYISMYVWEGRGGFTRASPVGSLMGEICFKKVLLFISFIYFVANVDVNFSSRSFPLRPV